MSNKQHKINPILNNNLPLFGILCFCGVCYLGFITNYWFLLFLLLVPLAFVKHKINWKQWLVIACFVIVFSLIIIFASDFSLIELINKRPTFIRNAILNFYDKHYNDETSSFIKLILFNIKSKDSWIFYKQTVDLGIVWLICISGFHVSLISKIIKLVFKKRPKIGKYVNISVISFYSLLLNFSYASLRVLLKLCFDKVFYKFEIKNLNKLGFIGICLCLFNPKCFNSYGFLLSFLVCSIAYFVNSLELNNKIINSLMINILAFIVTIPFLIEMNHKISLLTFLNAFIFTYFSAFIFVYFLIFCWFPFMVSVHYGIMVFAYVLVGNISFSNIFIRSDSWPIWGIFIYYGGIIGLKKALYLIVYNNKI